MILNNETINQKTSYQKTITQPYKWWQSTVFYEVYIASFQDSNGDGIGDFNGLTSRMDYLQSLGVTGLWITPFYPSPKIDNGYDVSDCYDIDPDFGCLEDFDRFVSEAHKRNIKVIIDVVLNHVSTEHAWFKDAISSVDSQYRDYFIFKEKMNNWESFFGGSAWEKEPSGSQYYYHKFAVEQADLNWRNPKLKSEMIKMLKFWLERGVDGFRLDVINFLSCSDVSVENPTDSEGLQIHQHDIDQPGIDTTIAEICDEVRTYSQSLNKECFLVGEIGHDELSKITPYQSEQLLDVVFNFNLGSVPTFDLENIYRQLKEMETHQSGLPTLFFNSHDMARSMSRLCHNNITQASALAALTLTLKGVCFLYFGEEIGMPDYEAKTVDDLRDISALSHYKLALDEGKSPAQAFEKAMDECRDKSRLYMQWNDEKYSGFSEATPWIGSCAIDPMPSVKQQLNDSESLWHWYQQLIALRANFEVLNYGRYQAMDLNDNLLLVSRCLNEEIIHILINFNDDIKSVSFNETHEILASKGFDKTNPDKLAPFGVLITREISNVC